MRRPHKRESSPVPHRMGSVKEDLTEKQLAAFGAAALAYNDLEDQIDALLAAVTRIPERLFDEVSSRIHGLDGKIAIIQSAIPNAGLPQKDVEALSEAVALFGDFKRIRDAMIHARIVNVSTSIGVTAKQRGKSPFEILLQEPALNSFYEHVVALRDQLSTGAELSKDTIARDQGDPNKQSLEQDIQARSALFRQIHDRRRSLKPLPKFPDEAEIHEAANRWRANLTARLMGWSQQWPEPPQRKPHSALFSDRAPPWVPRPPDPPKASD